MDIRNRLQKINTWHPLALCLLIGGGAGLVAVATIAPMMFLTELRRDDALNGVLGSLVFCPVFGATVGGVFWVFWYKLSLLLKCNIRTSTLTDQSPTALRRFSSRSILRGFLLWIVTGVVFGVSVVVVFNLIMTTLMVAEEGLVTAFRESREGDFFAAARLGLAGAWERLRVEGPKMVRYTWDMALLAGAPAGPIFWGVLLFLFRKR